MANPRLSTDPDQPSPISPQSGESVPREADSRVRLKVVRPLLPESRLSDDLDVAFNRPLTRADCQPGGEHHHRPCPFVSCVHNLFLVVAEDGAIVGDLERDPWEQDPDYSCSLDVVDEHPNGLDDDEAAVNAGLSVDEAEAYVRAAAAKMQAGMQEYEGQAFGEGGTTVLGDLCSNFQGGVEKGLSDHEDDRSGRVLPDRFYILHPPATRTGAMRFQRYGSTDEVPDAEYQRAVWKVYERASRSRDEELQAAVTATWVLFVDILLGIADAQLSRPVVKRRSTLVPSGT